MHSDVNSFYKSNHFMVSLSLSPFHSLLPFNNLKTFPVRDSKKHCSLVLFHWCLQIYIFRHCCYCCCGGKGWWGGGLNCPLEYHLLYLALFIITIEATWTWVRTTKIRTVLNISCCEPWIFVFCCSLTIYFNNMLLWETEGICIEYS